MIRKKNWEREYDVRSKKCTPLLILVAVLVVYCIAFIIKFMGKLDSEVIFKIVSCLFDSEGTSPVRFY